MQIILPRSNCAIVSYQIVFAATCEVVGPRVITFDHAAYNMGEVLKTDCEVILTQDCTTTKTFIISAKRLMEAPTMKVTLTFTIIQCSNYTIVKKVPNVFQQTYILI